MTVMTVPGISAAEERCLHEGAPEFFGRQGLGVLAEFLRREGGNPLSGDFGALAEPAVFQERARRLDCRSVENGPHFYI